MSYPPQPFTICSIRPSAFHAALLPAIEDLYHPQRGAPHCPAGTEAMLADPLLHLSPVSTQEIEQLQHVATTVDQHCPILTPNIIYKAIDAIDAIGTMCPCPSFLFRICVDVRTSWATSQSSLSLLDSNLPGRACRFLRWHMHLFQNPNPQRFFNSQFCTEVVNHKPSPRWHCLYLPMPFVSICHHLPIGKNKKKGGGSPSFS